MIEAAITSPERDAFEPKPLIVRLRKLEENKKRNYLCRHGRGGQRLDSGAALGGSDEGRASAEEEGRLHRCRGGRRRKQRRKDALKGERKKVELKIRRRRPVAFSSSTLSCASSSPSLLPSPRLSPSLSLFQVTIESLGYLLKKLGGGEINKNYSSPLSRLFFSHRFPSVDFSTMTMGRKDDGPLLHPSHPTHPRSTAAS